MEILLTEGAIKKIMNGEVTSQEEMIPVLQVAELKPVKTQQERYRMLLSDGTYLHQAMLGISQNVIVREGFLQSGSIVRLPKFVCNVIHNRSIIIIVELEVLKTTSDIIGNPVLGELNDQRGAADSGNKSNTTSFEQQQGRSQLTGGRTEIERTYAATPQPQVRADSGYMSNTASFEQQGRSEFTGGRQINNTEIERPYAATPPQVRADSGYMSNTTGFEQHGRSEFTGGRQINNPEIERTHAAIPPQVAQRQGYGTGSSFPGSAPSIRGCNNGGYGVPRQDHARDPPTAYPRQAAYRPQQPPPMYANRGPVARNDAPPRIIPINALSPYSGRWTIKARVTSKGELRHYNNPRGDGKVFNFDLLDADGGEIRVTCFNAVADQFFDQIIVGNLYLVSRGSLRPAQKNFNHLPNDYEITLDNASTIQQCYEEDATIPRHQFHFRSIGDIESLESNSVIDVIGIVSSISPTGSIMRKNGTETQKRSLQLKDMSGRSVEVTMWGNFCNSEGQKLQSLCDSGRFPVLAVKAGRISEFNGKAVSTIGSSQLFIDPDFVEAQKLKTWFEREGKTAPCISISREFSSSGRVDIRKTISQIKDEKLGTSEKPDWITVSATIIYMKFDNFCYTACPLMNGDRPCSKKVTDNGDGTWRCEKCDKCVDECDYRYILQLQIQDHTDLTWVTAFQEAGEEIMGMPAKDLYFMKYEDKDEDKFEDIIRRVTFTKYIFKLKVKEETFSDEHRVKSTVVKVDKLNYSSDTKTIRDAMEKLRTGDASYVPIKPEGSRDQFGLPANQSGQYGNQYSNGGCSLCGNSGHVSGNCPSGMSEPQRQYMGGSYGGGSGSYGGGITKQNVGGY